MRYDVLVVGAGPAGSTVARRCSESGLSVLLLDKAKFPREKPCGGGVNVHTARLLSFDLDPVVERTVSNICFSLRQSARFTKYSSHPVAYMTQRSRFDDFLVSRAIEAGAVLRQETGLQAVDITAGEILVKAGGELYTGNVLVAADGMNGLTARLAGIAQPRRMLVGLEGNFFPRGLFPQQWADTMGIDLGLPPGGYGWIFPKGDHLNLGVYGWWGAASRLRGELIRLARFYGFDAQHLQGVRGYRLPVRTPGAPLFQQRTLLVGDAAGLVDPFTGEGIFAAISSGIAASNAVLAYLDGSTSDLSGYQNEIEQGLGKEYRFADHLCKALNLVPTLAMTFLRYAPGAWELLAEWAQGSRSYTSMRSALGPVGWGIDGLAWLAQRIPALHRRAGVVDRPALQG
ncbi:MAG: NAD(P)/FAD-dependent oxidoreductase [Chloroflexi bacterium]|nr:NAD(P)/FAD-dependent oxidoreductase [Chloroflexota bacterium]